MTRSGADSTVAKMASTAIRTSSELPNEPSTQVIGESMGPNGPSELLQSEEKNAQAVRKWTNVDELKRVKWNKRQNNAYPAVLKLGGAYIQPWQKFVWLFAHIL